MKDKFEILCWLKRAYRQGLYFEKSLRMLEQSQQFNAAALTKYQNERLRRMVHHCYREVPYYQDLFSRLKLKPDDIQTQADLRKLPMMDKPTVNANFDKLIAKKRMNFLCKTAMTSGTTGSPARFIRDFQSINFENAAAWRQWREAGDAGKKRITLRGEVVVPMAQSEPPFWRYNPANHELLMCGFHLSLNTSKAYIDKVLEFKPAILSSYPSRAFLLAKFFRMHGVKYRFDAVFTSSENLDDGTRAFIEDVFQCPVYDWYGQAERVAAIGNCSAGSYHIQEDYSLVELMPSEEGHELVGTHLHNYVMPLLRYRTQDYVIPVTSTREYACRCGSAFRMVEEIKGRTCDYLLTPEGYRISCANHIFHGVEHVIEAQFQQDAPGEVLIRLVTDGGFTEVEREDVIRRTKENTSPRMKVSVVEVPEIPRGPNGKFITIINRVEDWKEFSSNSAPRRSSVAIEIPTTCVSERIIAVSDTPVVV